MQTSNNAKEKALSAHLLWDVDEKTFDIDKYPAWTIQRVLEYGDLDDWNVIKSHFGIDEIADKCKDMRTLDAQALSFICLLSNKNKEDFRCYNTRQSSPSLWNS